MCLPATRQEKGLHLAITLARDGSPALIEADDATCILEIGAGGSDIPPYSLDAATEKCLWDVMRDWRFRREAGCSRPVAYLEIGRREGGCGSAPNEGVEPPSSASTSAARPRSRPGPRSRGG